MKVCYVSHQPNLTGACQSLLDITSNWKGQDVEPVVLVRRKGPLTEELDKRNIRYKIIKYTTTTQSRKHKWKDLFRRIEDCMAVIKIKKFFKEEKFDIVHNNSLLSYVGMEAAYRANIPYICHIREFGSEDHGIKFRNEKRLYSLIKHSSATVFISDAIRKKFEVTASDTKQIIIYNGIDGKKYYQKHEEILSGDVINILLAGRIAPQKGQMEAIKAIEIMNNMGFNKCKLYIVGSIGNIIYNKECIKYVEEHNLTNIEFKEFTDLKQMRHNCDICLMCSTNEAMGRVTIESMMSGCLTIGADAGATPELIHHGETGLLYESGNSKALADTIMSAHGNRQKMNEVAIRGQEYAVREYDIIRYNEKLRKLYGEIVCTSQTKGDRMEHNYENTN